MPGVESQGVYNCWTLEDARNIVSLCQPGNRVVLMGAGFIGCIILEALASSGVDLTVVEMENRMVPRMMNEASGGLIKAWCEHKGVRVHTSTKVEAIEASGGALNVVLSNAETAGADMVISATGVRANIGFLEGSGIDTDHGILVDTHLETTQPGIYAAGDVIGFPSLASTSMAQGRYAACHAFGTDVSSQPELFPYGIYAVPEISMVGLTEQECSERSIAYEVGIARFRETARGQIIGLREGMLKMLFSIETQKLLGVHIIGEGATELVHIGQAVISLGGTLDYFVQTVFNYPTLAEAYKVAALDAYNRMTF